MPALNLTDYDWDLHEEFVELIHEFLKAPLDAVRRALQREAENPGICVAEAWNQANPKTPDEIERFYRETHSYIYALGADHCQRSRGHVWKVVIERMERLGTRLNVLVYGDGIGTDSLTLARRGHRVTYFDLPGATSLFARFRFERARLSDQIRVVVDESVLTSTSFDAVVCIEVLEHLPEPLRVMKNLTSYTRLGGKILLTESFGSVGPEFPSHLPSNAVYAGLTCRLMEGLGTANTYYNLNPVNYPMEFTRVDSGPLGLSTKTWYRLRRAIHSRFLRAFGARRGA
jgi:2-polyprenyl-3-methyl-5-hydroxy-6-metoxy-1,4-benzoquinol methylase